MKKIAVFVHDLYNELELFVPYYRLKEAGHDVKIVGSGSKLNYQGKSGLSVTADVLSKDCIKEDFDGVIIPGGYAPDKIRMDENSLEIVKKAFDQGKIVAAICHAGWVLVSANVLHNKKATCYKAIKDDIVNAGATFLDEEVVVDGNLITSRTPDDLPAFCREIVKALENK